MTESKLRELTQKLERQEDITIEEADEIYFLANSVIKAARDIIDRKPAIYEQEAHELLSKDFPVSALKDWYDAVADKIRTDQSGNFIFSILIADGMSYYYNYLNTAVRALRGDERTERYKDHVGAFEDRIISIRANKQIYKLFPKPFKKLFQWKENFQWNPCKWLFELKINRAGFFRYPLHELEGGTISQLFKKLSLKSIMIPQEESSIVSMINVGRYVLMYLKEKFPFIQVNAERRYDDDIAVFTNEEGLLIAEAVLDIPIEEFLKNAIAQNIIDKRTASALLSSQGYLAGFLDAEFTKANLKYIDDIAGDILKMNKARMEWKATKKTVEDEAEWLEEIR